MNRACLLRAVWIAASVALASPATAQTPPESRPFVEHHLALQLSDGTPDKQALVLSVANNVLKTYGLDKVAIEVVAFGPGVALLRAGNPNAVRVASLVAQGVRFDACGITLETIRRKTGKPFPLQRSVQVVSAGVPQLMTLAEHGYEIVRP